MTPMLFRICLTTITLLQADFVIGSDLQDFVKTIKAEGGYNKHNSKQHFSKKSLVILISDLPSESAEENDQEDRTLLRSQDLSGKLLVVDNDVLRMPAASIIKNNSSNYVSLRNRSNRLKKRPPRASEERANFREQQVKEQIERDHERRVKEIVDHVSVNYQSCIYLAYEARRIKTGGIVMDEFRKMAEDVEKQKYQGLKAKALQCGKPIREPTQFVWHKPNKVRIDIVKDSLNDGV